MILKCRPQRPRPIRACASARISPVPTPGICHPSLLPGKPGKRRIRDLEQAIERYRSHEGRLTESGERLLQAYQDADALGQLAYRVWYFAALHYDEDQRDNAVAARRQRVQILIARWRQATSWFSPELLQIPLATVRVWMAASAELAVYRFAIEDLFRQQAHVLDAAGEQLLSLSGRLASTPADAYSALSTADARFPTITLSTGESVQVSYGQYRRAAGHLPSAGRPSRGLRGAVRHLWRIAQHLRHALQRRDAARVVRGAGARLRHHARRRACSATTSRPAWWRT